MLDAGTAGLRIRNGQPDVLGSRSRNVNDIWTPVPSTELSASSVQPYEQGDAGHVDDDASKKTGDPVTGLDGL